MARYIDADKLRDEVDDTLNWETINEYNMYSDIMYMIDNAPTEDVQPVKHGRWIDTEPEYNYERHCSAHYQCSECGRRTGIRQTRTYKYCQNCGAKMEGCDK